MTHANTRQLIYTIFPLLHFDYIKPCQMSPVCVLMKSFNFNTFVHFELS